MFLFVIEAIPKPTSPHFEEVGGAYVQCWIDFIQEQGAEHLARYYLEEEGWQPLHVEEVHFLGREDIEDDSDSLPYFLEAKQDGLSLVFHTWPIGAEEDEEEAEED